MHNPRLAQARAALYPRVIQQAINLVSEMIGLRITQDIISLTYQRTRPVVNAGRELARDLAYQDYLFVVDNDPVVEAMDLGRLTDDVWYRTIKRTFEDHEFFDDEVLEEIGMQVDHWTRDAEFGQKIAVAKADRRLGRVARVDPEPPSCPFCTLLNSRGPVYLNEETAAMTLHLGDECELVFVPAGTEDDYPGKDSVDQAKELYKKAVEKAPTGSSKDILKALGEMDPNRPEGRIKQITRAATENAVSSQVRESRSRLETLERLQPETESGKRFRDEQITRNRDILSVLETNSV